MVMNGGSLSPSPSPGVQPKAKGEPCEWGMVYDIAIPTLHMGDSPIAFQLTSNIIMHVSVCSSNVAWVSESTLANEGCLAARVSTPMESQAMGSQALPLHG